MKNICKLLIIFCVSIVFAMTMPMVSDATPKYEKKKSLVHKKTSAKQVTTVQITKKHKAKNNLKQNLRAEQQQHKKHKKIENAKNKKNFTPHLQSNAVKIKKSLRTAKKSESSKKTAVDNRTLWMKRAKDSEIMTGIASWYGKGFHGGTTASGVKYNMYTFTAAHKTLPLGTVVRVTDKNNGKSVMVCVTDRGPYVRGRIIDLSYAAAQQLDLSKRGISKVNLEVVSDSRGTPLKKSQAYYVRYKAARGHTNAGPFRAFADAAAAHEAIRLAHPDAEVVLGHHK